MSVEDKFIKLYLWMKELKLSPSELLVYALIYSYTNEGKKEGFHGAADYLASSNNISRGTVVSILKSLTKKGLIKKKKAGKFRNYSIPYEKNLNTISEKFEHYQ